MKPTKIKKQISKSIKKSFKSKPFKILLFTTGGTIEKIYNQLDGSLENRKTRIKKKLAFKLKLPMTKVQVFPIMSKDSLYMTDYDREKILNKIKKYIYGKVPIVILHGTDTMTRTAEFCLKQLSQPTVPVIFTGAMIPMDFEHSDATQNVTEALLAAKLLTPGFYIGG